ncbi:MAG: ribonuclease HI [Clostridia bacterium]|nr:ribonuclease HI [Clostridia bacterium]
MKKVTVYTDGSSLGNPGPGGYGAILFYKEHKKEISGGEAHTTNNRMEMRAVIEALSLLREPCEVELYSDSRYVIDSVTRGWVYSWQKNGWKKADKSPAQNRDLWETLLPLLERHRVSFIWVKGHADNEYNERCDELAVAFAKSLKKTEGEKADDTGNA